MNLSLKSPSGQSIKDITGQKFGRYTVIKFSHRDRRAFWLCRCDCGVERVILGSNLRTGRVKSCGCLHVEQARALHMSHGGSYSPEYGAWKKLRLRCNNKKDRAYHNYGGRGIKVCSRWAKFKNFYEDMGPRPSSEHSIDRIDNNGNYEPSNCRWATTAEQSRNKRNNVWVLYNGEKIILSDLAKLLGWDNKHLKFKIKRGDFSEAKILK